MQPSKHTLDGDPKGQHRGVNSVAKVHARRLRREQTPAEVAMLHELRRRHGRAILAQVPLQGYVADLLIGKARLIVELDGSHHWNDPTQRAYDQRRTDRLAAAGYTVIRFANAEVLHDVRRCADVVTSTYHLRLEERRAAKAIGAALRTTSAR